MRKKLVASILFVFCFLLLVGCTNASASIVINFKDSYQDWQGNWHLWTKENVDRYPLYRVVEKNDVYIIERLNVSLSLPKRSWISYDFYITHIVPKIKIGSYDELLKFALLSLGSRYLSIPWSASQVRNVSDDFIDMGVFYRTNRYVIRDSTPILENTSTLKEFHILPKVVGNEIKLYFNPLELASATYPIWIEEQTIWVNNTTYPYWENQNIVFSGVRYTDNGEIALHLNDTLLDGLVAYWSMDEYYGTSVFNVNNASGYRNTTNQGTWYGNVSVNSSAGRIGRALSFDGVDDYVNCWNNESLNITDAITVEMWIKTITQKNYQWLLTKGSGNPGYELMLAINNQIYWELRTATGNVYVIGIFNYSDGNWHHIVGTKDISGNAMLFVDSTLIKTGIGAIGSNPSAYLYIGARTNHPFNGLIDEVRIYNRALSSDEVVLAYSKPFRTQGELIIYNQKTVNTSPFLSIKITASNLNSNSTIDIYAKANSSANWKLITLNASSDVSYFIPESERMQSIDVKLRLNGNGSTTPFLSQVKLNEANLISGLYPLTTYVVTLNNTTKMIMQSNSDGNIYLNEGEEYIKVELWNGEGLMTSEIMATTIILTLIPLGLFYLATRTTHLALAMLWLITGFIFLLLDLTAIRSYITVSATSSLFDTAFTVTMILVILTMILWVVSQLVAALRRYVEKERAKREGLDEMLWE
jgi:hypothetical protein